MQPETLQQIRNDALYHRYTDRQARDADLLRNDEGVHLAYNFDYSRLSGLSGELTAKLMAIRPTTLAAAAKIEGMTPAALTLLLTATRISARKQA